MTWNPKFNSDGFGVEYATRFCRQCLSGDVKQRRFYCRCFSCYMPIWLMVWNMKFIFPYIGNFIIPTDFNIFQRGWYTTNQPSIELKEVTLW